MKTLKFYYVIFVFKLVINFIHVDLILLNRFMLNICY